MTQNKNTLNLVYDSWFDGLTPKKNGNEYFSEISFGDTHHLIWSYLDRGLFYEYQQHVIKFDDLFQIKKCKINEVYERTDENFYYFISIHGYDYFSFFTHINFKNFFNQVLKNLLENCKNFYVGFLTEHECDGIEGFRALNNFVNDSNFNPEQFYFINNNSLIYNLKKELDSKINIYKINFLQISSTRVLEKSGDCNLVVEKNGKFFMCFNRGPKKHRYGLLCLLKKNNILEDTNWSLIPIYDPHARPQFYEEIFDKETINNLRDEIIYFSNVRIKKNDYELDAEYIDNDGNFVDNILPEWMLVPTLCVNHENTYVNIVTESEYFDYKKVIHITEKSFKPFFYYQLPNIVATSGHIKKMREQYDYDFFDDIINHDYDNEENSTKRLFKITEEIKRLNDNKEHIKEFYRNNQQRFIDNKNKVYKMLLDLSDFTFFKNLI